MLRHVRDAIQFDIILVCARKTERPTEIAKQGIDRAFRYSKGTRDFGLVFKKHST